MIRLAPCSVSRNLNLFFKLYVLIQQTHDDTPASKKLEEDWMDYQSDVLQDQESCFL